MLTTIGDQILEIRPKQIIESNTKLDSDYLILVTKSKRTKEINPRIKKNEKLPERSSTNTSSSP